MGEVLVVSGPPGAGTSTLAALLVDDHDPGALVAGDAFLGFLRRGRVDPWLPAAQDQNDAVIPAAAAAAGHLARHATVVYDGIVGPWFLQHFIAHAQVTGVHYVLLLPPLDTCLDRVRSRTGHGFADLDATRKMHEDFAKATAHTWHARFSGRENADDLAAEVRVRLARKQLWVGANGQP